MERTLGSQTSCTPSMAVIRNWKPMLVINCNQCHEAEAEAGNGGKLIGKGQRRKVFTICFKRTFEVELQHLSCSSESSVMHGIKFWNLKNVK